MLARRFTALSLAVSLTLSSLPPGWAGDGIVSTPVSTPITAGPITAGQNPVFNNGLTGPATQSGNLLKTQSHDFKTHRQGFNDSLSPSPYPLPAPRGEETGAAPSANDSATAEPANDPHPLPAERGEVPAGRLAGGEGGSSVLSALTEQIRGEKPSDPVAARKHLDKTFTGANTAPESLPVVVSALPSALRAPAPLRPQGSGWFNGLKRLSGAPRNGAAQPAASRISYDYARMFDIARRTLTRPAARKFIKEAFAEELTLSEDIQKKYQLPEKINEMSQSQFLMLLQNNPGQWALLEQYLDQMEKFDEKSLDSAKIEAQKKEWNEKFRALLAEKDLVAKFKRLNDPLEPFYLEAKDGSPGYSIEGRFADHVSISDGKEVPASDLKKVVLDFIAGAQHGLMVNVFDFDLMEVADAMIERGAAGVKVTVGIDKKNIEARPEVKAVFDKLSKAKNVTAVAVDSVALDHQKLMVRDWEDEQGAKTLFSSGNLTQSCIGPEGDLVDGKGVPGVSAPNANHMLVLGGFLVAQAAADSLIKTLEYKLRGIEYPLGGAFQLEGPKAAGAKEAPTLTLAFSPKGGLGDINRDITRRVLLESRGPVRMLQFAFSSESLYQALIERAKAEKKDFDFKSIGDTPFALRDWSVFLALSGYELKVHKDGSKEYVESKENPLRDALGKERYEAVRKDIRVAPPVYRESHVKDAAGNDVKVNAKLHHKVLVSGDLVIAGTSFNFSENANSNNEQFLLFKDPDLAAWMTGVFDGLYRQALVSVAAAAEARNAYLKGGGKDDEGDDNETKGAAMESALYGLKRGGVSNEMAPKPEPGPSLFRAEVVRKIFHQSLLLYLGAYHLLGEKTALAAMAVWTAGVAVFEIARLGSVTVRDFVQKHAGGIIREKEQNRFTGTFYVALGILSVFFLYGSHPAIVTASILYLAFGDAASALIGRRFGRHKYQVLGQDRSLEGTAGGLAVALGVGFAMGFSPLMIAAGAGAFLLADVLPLPPDDNFWIPVMTGTALWLAGGGMVQSVTVTNIFSILALGFILGMRHATDSDHVAAVATIVSRSKQMGTAWLLGAFWGLGHTATIFAVGAAIILFRVVIPPHVGLGMEFLVGVVLAGLGLANIAGYWTGAGSTTAHEHAHGHDSEHEHGGNGSQHSHAHIHTEPANWVQRTLQAAGWAQITRSISVGLMHGLAGSAAVALLVLATIPEPLGAMVYLLVFGAGTLAGMLTLSALMEFSMFKLTRWWKPGERAFIVLTGLISLAYGAWLIYQIGYVGGLFSAHPNWIPH